MDFKKVSILIVRCEHELKKKDFHDEEIAYYINSRKPEDTKA